MIITKGYCGAQMIITRGYGFHSTTTSHISYRTIWIAFEDRAVVL